MVGQPLVTYLSLDWNEADHEHLIKIAPDYNIVIPVKTGIQTLSLPKQGTRIWSTGFPRIRYRAGLVKRGMTIKVTGLMTHYTSYP